MKKRGPSLIAIKDRPALLAIWYALEGNPSWLARSLRSGTASTAEQGLAADLIEGKIKPRRPRSFWSQREQRLEIAQDYVLLKKLCSQLPKRERQEKALKSFIADKYGVSMRHVDNVLAEFDHKALSEIERIDAQSQPSGLDYDTLEQMYEYFYKYIRARK